MKKRTKKTALTAFILIFVSLIAFISAEVDLGVRPSEININLFTNEQNCTDIIIFSSDKQINITAIDKWVDNSYTLEVDDYIKTAEEIGLNINYQKVISIKRQYSEKICVNASKKGDYQGIIIYANKENKAINIPLHLKISVGEKSIIQTRPAPNTANAANTDYSQYTLLLLLPTLIFIIIFIVLTRINKIKNKQF